VEFFPQGGIQLHTFVSYALPCQTPFCQTAPLLLSVARQQNLTEYWREGSTSTAISTAFASDFVGQHNKIGVITFGAAIVHQGNTFRSLVDNTWNNSRALQAGGSIT
jgi:hypothetical protein